MLFFKHPTPFSRKEVAVQMVSRGTAPPPDTTVIMVESRPPRSAGASAQAAEAKRISSPA
jgi:hypothetical protein